MNLIPTRLILTIAFICGLLTYAAIVVDIPARDDPGTFSSDNEGFEKTPDAAMASDNQQQFDQIIGVSMAIIVFVLITGMLNLSYRRILNSGEVKQLINTNLQLAGFPPQAGYIGRNWELADGLEMQLFVQSSVFFQIRAHVTSDLESDIDPRIFGLQWKDNTVVTVCSPPSLQLTLQSIRRFMDSIYG